MKAWTQQVQREIFTLDGGYMSIFEDDEKEPAYNYLHILYWSQTKKLFLILFKNIFWNKIQHEN